MSARSARPVLPAHVVQRREVRRRVVVDDVLARQLPRSGSWSRSAPSPSARTAPAAFRFSHRIFGPTDCEVSALPQRSRITSSPIRAFSCRDLAPPPGCRRRKARRSSAARRPHPPAACRARWRWPPRRDVAPDQSRTAPASACVIKTKSPHQSSSARCSAQPGLRHQHLVRPASPGDDPARHASTSTPFDLERADVDAERVGHGAPRRGRTSGVDPAKAPRPAAAPAPRDRQYRTPPARNASSASGTRHRGTPRPLAP